ncbi:MAG: rhamnogalacturonan lyase [Spirosomataceae bacterium]
MNDNTCNNKVERYGYRSIFILSLFITFGSLGQQIEHLNRGIVAFNQGKGQAFVSWRLLGTEPKETAFNVYKTAKNQTVKLNAQPLVKGTNFIDAGYDSTVATSYTVKAVLKGVEDQSKESYLLPANEPNRQYLSIPLQTIAGYTPNDASVGDLDGDGTYEIILHQTGIARDNSQKGFTSEPIFEAYRLDGTLLWRINLGKNIRDGAHYTQFMVYDLDGDGKAEFACKTADGTVDGKGKVIGDANADYRNKDGRILDGPEFFTIFDGLTGAALATTDYVPSRGNINGWGGKGGNGGNDHNGNRSDRFLACIAYLDGQRPSVVMCRGYYGRSVLAAWDWRGGKLTSRWVFDSKDGSNPFSGQGYHNLSVADVDGDGKDEIVYGSMVVDDNGKGLFTTGLRHGDALHVSDLDPSNKGLEVFGVHEIEEQTIGTGAALYDAKTGTILWRGSENTDVGRGVAEDIDSTNAGAEMWWSGSKGLYSMQGKRIGENPSSTNFLIWWDGDLTRELLNSNRIDKYGLGTIFTAQGCVANNGTKSNPTLSADLFGDWREEVIFRTQDNKELRIFSTTIPTSYRVPTLMHDHQYRLSIAWQNVGYNQPPHLSYYLRGRVHGFN